MLHANTRFHEHWACFTTLKSGVKHKETRIKYKFPELTSMRELKHRSADGHVLKT